MDGWLGILSSVYSYELSGPDVGLAVSLVAPFLQIALALCLLARVFVDAAYALSAFLFSVYSYAQISVIWKGLNITCGCFGVVNSGPISYSSFVFVAVLALSCMSVYLMRHSAGRS